MAENLGNLFIDGESVIEDETGKTISKYGDGNLSVDTSISKVGASSIKCVTGAVWDRHYTGDHNDWAFYTGDYTVDLWLRTDTIASSASVIGQWLEGHVGYQAWEVFRSGSTLQWKWFTTSASSLNFTTSLQINTWYHIAAVKSGTSVKLYLDGIQVASDTETGSIPNLSGRPLYIGYKQDNASGLNAWWFQGNLDNVRVVKGEALWTTNFDINDSSEMAYPDEEDPIVDITSHWNSYKTSYTTTDLSGTATDNVDIASVTWLSSRGGSGSATGTENWSINNLPLLEGANEIQVTAEDSAGNIGRKTVMLYHIPNRNKISYIYDQSNSGNIRGAAKQGYIRPTISQFFTTANFEEITSILATGGTTYSISGYRVHVFNENDTFEIIEPIDEVEYLIVAGGGAGGKTSIAGAGGGGAGGMLTGTYTITGSSYPIVIGAGGASTAANGQNSTAFGLSAIGGGGGAWWSNSTPRAAKAGGSGGGDAWVPGTPGAGTAGQGYRGGYFNGGSRAAAGGGGAGAVGSNAGDVYLPDDMTGGDGGIGKLSSITGTATYYAGGGGGAGRNTPGAGGNGGGGAGGYGSTYNETLTGIDGEANTGGGGGGAHSHGATNGYPAGKGGSGIVIVRYQI